jgi:hypothetical protein
LAFVRVGRQQCTLLFDPALRCLGARRDPATKVIRCF